MADGGGGPAAAAQLDPSYVEAARARAERVLAYLVATSPEVSLAHCVHAPAAVQQQRVGGRGGARMAEGLLGDGGFDAPLSPASGGGSGGAGPRKRRRCGPPRGGGVAEAAAAAHGHWSTLGTAAAQGADAVLPLTGSPSRGGGGGGAPGAFTFD